MLSFRDGLAEINSNPMAMMEILCLMLWSFAILFLSCELGEMVSTQFDMFEMELRQCDWLYYPIELRRMLVIFMLNAQMPTIIRGFAITSCTRECFMEVQWCYLLGIYQVILIFVFILDVSIQFLLFHDTSPNWCLIFFTLAKIYYKFCGWSNCHTFDTLCVCHLINIFSNTKKLNTRK